MTSGRRNGLVLLVVLGLIAISVVVLATGRVAYTGKAADLLGDPEQVHRLLGVG